MHLLLLLEVCKAQVLGTLQIWVIVSWTRIQHLSICPKGFHHYVCYFYNCYCELHKTGEEPDYHFIREDEILAISHCSLIKTSYHRLTSKEWFHITISHSFELCWTYNSKNKKNSEYAATSHYKEEKHHRMAPGHNCRLRKLYILYLWHWKHKYKTN